MRYFAMIDGRRCGPYTLEQLPDAGVTPQTYVWCKGMDDWQQAADVADICRFYRQRLFGLMHPDRWQQPPAQQSPEQPAPDDPRYLSVRTLRPDLDDLGDITSPPTSMLLISLLLTLFCFPLTGFVAIYFSYRSRQCWEESRRSLTKGSKNLYTEKEREKLRTDAHDYARQAKMWAGITFFLGIILYAFLGHSIR